MKGILFGLLAVAMVLFVATPASALYLKAGELLAHFTDASALYVDDDGDPATPRIPRPPVMWNKIDPQVVPPGWQPLIETEPDWCDEERVVVDINQFLQGGTPYYSMPGGELTGLLYDLHLDVGEVSTNVAGQTILDLYYGPLGRNPLTPDADSPAGSGGVLEMWLDPTPDGEGVTLFDPMNDGLAPFYWAEGGGPGGRDGYPTVNNIAGTPDDSVLWLQCVFAPLFWVDLDGDGFDETPIYKHEQINVDTGAGFLDGMYVNIIGGSAADLFDRDVYGPGLDLSLTGTLWGPPHATYWGSPQDIGNWAVRSSDPAQGNVSAIPEPATMMLLGLGLLGLGARIRRKK